jgi:hypothetical protein
MLGLEQRSSRCGQSARRGRSAAPQRTAGPVSSIEVTMAASVASFSGRSAATHRCSAAPAAPGPTKASKSKKAPANQAETSQSGLESVRGARIQKVGPQRPQPRRHAATSPVQPLTALPAPSLVPLQAASLAELGQQPYAYRFDRSHYTSELQVPRFAKPRLQRPALGHRLQSSSHTPTRPSIKLLLCVRHRSSQAQYADLAPGTAEPSGAVVQVAGRLTAKRVMGKLAFLGLRDDKGQIQVPCGKRPAKPGQPRRGPAVRSALPRGLGRRRS